MSNSHMSDEISMVESTVHKGMFGRFGGRHVPPELLKYLDELEEAYLRFKDDDGFRSELYMLLKDYVGRPSPLYFASRLSEELGARIYLKREDLNHTGAHKINNTLGQALLAKRMGKPEVVAETGAGQHGVATATVCALLGMRCRIFMGEIDAKKQSMNVNRMRLLGADVTVVKSGGRCLKDAVDEALLYLIRNPHVFYLLGSVVGPHPYPTIVRDFQRVIGEEARMQIMEKEGRLPHMLVACVGGGSNAMGLFHDFVGDKDVRLVAVEPAGKGLDTGMHAATLSLGSPGVIHGFSCLLLQDDDGEPLPVHSIASGLDYPGVGPEPSMLKVERRLDVAAVTDDEAIDAFRKLSLIEGIIPALESSHAIAYLFKERERIRGKVVIANLSGRGDKDLDTVLDY